jgi:hypothetical protein
MSSSTKKKRTVKKTQPVKKTSPIKKKSTKRRLTARPVALTVRPRRTLKPRLAADDYYFEDPTYGGYTSYQGGTWATCVLTYRGGDSTNYGSTPGTTDCRSVNDLNAEDAKNTPWIKGHLLNDNLGGPGISKNLTPMTHTQNVNFQGSFESKIKSALVRARQVDEAYGGDYWYGVRISVRVGPAGAGATQALRAVASRVYATAIWVRVEKKPKAEWVVEDLSRATPAGTTLPTLRNYDFDPGDP